MKHTKFFVFLLACMLLLPSCSTSPQNVAVQIELNDNGIRVDGKTVSTDSNNAVYVANDIVYYESGKDFTYGEGTANDAHSAEQAAAHTVVHITKPGQYTLSGTLSKGQIAVDLGEDAKDDPKAVVTLVLNGVDITCEVAPAVIFYNVYECDDADEDTAQKDVDTAAAGANVLLADGCTNTVNGSYVAHIYKPDSVELNSEGTEVEDAKKLHKYDGAFYSKMSMNINGTTKNTGVLNINAENEGLDSERHLTINGGNIHIRSGNDGINTNEDGVSVTTVNGGNVSIVVTGTTGEGDGIDSNGWLVINGGTVTASACSDSADAGIDSDMGIHINGGTVIASGNMLDRIENGGQTYAVFHFSSKQNGLSPIYLKDASGTALLNHTPQNAYSILIFSAPALNAGDYTFWSGNTQLQGVGGVGMRPGGMTPPEGGSEPPSGEIPPDRPQPPNGEQSPPDGFTRPEGEGVPQERPKWSNGDVGGTQELSTTFTIQKGANMFSGIQSVA